MRTAGGCSGIYEPVDVTAAWGDYVTACQNASATEIFITNETESLVIRAEPAGSTRHYLWPAPFEPAASLVAEVVAGTCVKSEYCIPPGRTMWFESAGGVPGIALSRAPYASLGARVAVIQADLWLERLPALPKNLGHLVKCAEAVGNIQISQSNPYVDGFTHGIETAIACDKVRADLGYRAREEEAFVTKAATLAEEADGWAMVRDFFHLKLWRIHI